MNKAAKIPEPSAATASASEAEEAVEQLGRTINVQTVFLGIIAGVLVLYTLYFSSTVAIPLVLACMFNLVLDAGGARPGARQDSGAGRAPGWWFSFVLLVLGIGVFDPGPAGSRMAAPAALSSSTSWPTGSISCRVPPSNSRRPRRL